MAMYKKVGQVNMYKKGLFSGPFLFIILLIIIGYLTYRLIFH
jgi:hypothetical protein